MSSTTTLGHIRARESEPQVSAHAVVAVTQAIQQRATKRQRLIHENVALLNSVVVATAATTAIAAIIPPVLSSTSPAPHAAATPVYSAATLQALASLPVTASSASSSASSSSQSIAASLQIDSLARVPIGQSDSMMMVPDRITWSSNSVQPCTSMHGISAQSFAIVRAVIVSSPAQHPMSDVSLTCPVCGASVTAVTLSQAASKSDVMHIELRLAPDLVVTSGTPNGLPLDWWTLIQVDVVAFTNQDKAKKKLAQQHIRWTLQPFGAHRIPDLDSQTVKFDIDLRDMAIPWKERMFGTKQFCLCLRFRYGPFTLLHLAPFRIHAHSVPERSNLIRRASWQLQSQWCSSVTVTQAVRCIDRIDSLEGGMLGLQVYIEWLNLMADWKGARLLIDCARSFFESLDDRHAANDALAILAVLDVQLMYLSNTTAACSSVVGPVSSLEQQKNHLLTKVQHYAQHSKGNHVLLLAYYQMWRSLTGSETSGVDDAYQLSQLQSDDSILAGLLYNSAAKQLSHYKRKGVSALLKCRDWRTMYLQAMDHDQRMAQRAANFETDTALQILLDQLVLISRTDWPASRSLDSSSTPPASSDASSRLFNPVPAGRTYDFSWSSGQRPFAESTVILLEYVVSVEHERRRWLAAALKRESVDIRDGEDIGALNELYQIACHQFFRLQDSATRMTTAWPTLAPQSRINCIHQVNAARWEYLHYLLEENPVRLTNAKKAASLAKSLATCHHLLFYLGEAEKILREVETRQNAENFAQMVTY